MCSLLQRLVGLVLIASSLSLAHAEGVPEGLGTFIGAWRARNAGQPWPTECDLNGDGVLDTRDANACLWQAFGGLWSQVRVLDAVTLQPLPGATVTVAGSSAQTDAKGLAALGCRRGTQAVQVCGPGHVTWEGVLPFVSGFSPALYLVPTPLRVTVANHQEDMEAAYNLAVALTPILTELNGAAPAPGSVPPTDTDLRAAARRICQLQAVQQLSGVTEEILTQVQALSTTDATVGSAQVRPAGLTGLWGMKKGADKLMDQERRALAGESVPEIDAYLSAHPYYGYRSLAQLRGDLGKEGVGAFFADYVFLARSQNGVDEMVMAGASVAVSGYPSASPGSLVGQYVSDTWGPVQGWITSKVVDGLFSKGLQYLLGIGSSGNSGRTVIGVTQPDGTTKVAWPGGTWQLTASGGKTYATTKGSVTITSGGQTVAVTHPQRPLPHGMIDLGTLSGGSYSEAWGINDAGQVVGGSDIADGSHAFLWDPGTATMRDLGTLPGDSYSGARGINDAGQVVGQSYTAYGAKHAFLWDPGTATMRGLGTLPGGAYSVAWGINDAGQVVGASYTTDGYWRAFLWDPAIGTMRDLGTLGGCESWAWGINDAGQVVGASYTTDGYRHAFLWDPAIGTMRDLGTLGGPPYSEAYGINDAGQVVGYSDTADGAEHAFLWDPTTGTMRDLGTLGGSCSYAYGINDAGQVVGYSDAASGEGRAFLWEPGAATMRDLGTLPGDSCSHACGINDAGQAVGWSGAADGWGHAFLWNP